MPHTTIVSELIEARTLMQQLDLSSTQALHILLNELRTRAMLDQYEDDRDSAYALMSYEEITNYL